MNGQKLKLFSPQAANIYRLLQNGKPLTAKEIAKGLHVFPNTIYRAITQLQEKGFVKEMSTYPITYQIQPEHEALDVYSLILKKQFQTVFPKKYRDKSFPAMDISFIQTRSELNTNTDINVKEAKSTVDFIVSGLEVSTETILTYKNAIDKGVVIRSLVQRLDDTSEQMFKNWKRIGLQIRYFPNMEARVFIVDKEIVYFTSYNPEKKEEALGMRFNYRPYAKIMDELFEQRWKVAKEIS